MKLRIRADTLRLRLTRGEVDRIARGEAVEESTHFPDGSVLGYQLVPGELEAARQENTNSSQQIIVEIPAGPAAEWASCDDEVGFNGAEPFRVGPLTVLIEKDFECLTPRQGEEELDTYPNPNAAS